MILEALFFATSAFAAETPDSDTAQRPSEESMFSGQTPPQRPERLRDAFASGEVKENPLEVGGTYYQQFIFSGQSGTGLKNDPITAPLQVDGYLDGRPNDRIRAFVDGRLLYDPTRDLFSNSTNSNSTSVQTLQTQSTTTATSATGSSTTPNNPQVVLDQAWLSFDIDRTVFVTAGKQHLKWGTSRYWNPTDLLTSQKRNPLLPYDLRLGNYMVKFEMPLQRKGTNLYAIGLFDNPQPASTAGQLGGALRAETLIGDVEAGLDAVFRGGATPTYGADFSSAVGVFDVYGEAALITGGIPVYNAVTLTSGTNIANGFGTSSIGGPSVQVSGGVSHDFAWREDRQATIGVEYFYNQIGYTSSAAYQALILSGAYRPFYTGRNYAAIYLTAEGPDADKRTSYTFSTLGNLSDKSFISRAELSWRVLTYLTFDTYVDGHYGAPGGEFNFSLSTPAVTNGTTPIPAINVPVTYFDIGMSLRVSI